MFYAVYVNYSYPVFFFDEAKMQCKKCWGFGSADYAGVRKIIVKGALTPFFHEHKENFSKFLQLRGSINF